MSNINVGTVTLSNGLKLPSFTNSTRPTGSEGLMIYNSEDKVVQTFIDNQWVDVGGGSKPDGSSIQKAASSVTELKTLGGVTNNGVYWFKDSGNNTYQAYALMDSAYDGGGWILLYNINASSANTSIGGIPHWDNNQFWLTQNELNNTVVSPWSTSVKTRAYDRHPANEFLILIHNKLGYSPNSSTTRGWSVYTNSGFAGQTHFTITSGGNNRQLSSSGRKTNQNYVGNLSHNSRRPQTRGGDAFIDGIVNGFNNGSDNLIINATEYWGSNVNNTRLTTTAGNNNASYGHTTSGIGIRHQFSGWGYYAGWTPIQSYCEPPAMYTSSTTMPNNYTSSPESGNQIHLSCNEIGWANGYLDAGISVFVR